jgi:hypothetical protein
LIASAPVLAQQIRQATTDEIMENSRRFAGLTRREDCRAEAARSSDIVVCGSRNSNQALPAPEIFGPVPGSTDGSAVDPRGVPCGASISNQCWGGGDVLGTIGGAINLVGLILDPDKNLGEGDPVPERFRGANR